LRVIPLSIGGLVFFFFFFFSSPREKNGRQPEKSNGASGLKPERCPYRMAGTTPYLILFFFNLTLQTKVTIRGSAHPATTRRTRRVYLTRRWLLQSSNSIVLGATQAFQNKPYMDHVGPTTFLGFILLNG